MQVDHDMVDVSMVALNFFVLLILIIDYHW